MKFIILVAFAVILSGCGIQKIAEETRDGVNKSNGTQKDLLDTVEKTRALTEELKGSIKKTEEGVHLQILTVALEQMFKAENTAVLSPPARIMVYAEVFAKEATVEELTKAFYIWIKDAENSPPDDKRYGQISLTVMGAIAGLASDAKTKEILKNEVENHGRYEDSALAFALVRYNFIRDFLFKPVLGSKTLNLGSLKETLKYYNQLGTLVKLPYANRFGLEVAALEVSLKLIPEEFAKLGLAAKAKFDQSKSPDLQSKEAQDLLKILVPAK